MCQYALTFKANGFLFVMKSFSYINKATLVKTITTPNNLEQPRTTWNNPEQPRKTWNSPEQSRTTRNNLEQPDTGHIRKWGPRPGIFCRARNILETQVPCNKWEPEPGIPKNWGPFIGKTQNPRPYILTGTRDQGPGHFKNIREDGTLDLSFFSDYFSFFKSSLPVLDEQVVMS